MTALVEQLKHGLDAPICLTWELTYACNLECVHCLSSSGRRDPRELDHRRGQARARRAARPAGLLRQHRRWRADDPSRLLRARRVRDRTRHRREVLHQRCVHRRRQGARASPRWTTSTSRSASTAPTPRRTTPCAATARTPRPAGRWTISPRPGSSSATGRSRSRSSSPGTTSTSSTSSRRSPTRTARSCASPACARPAAAPTPGTTCTRPTSSSARSTGGCSRTASTCSRATRSSTSTRSASRCPASTCAAPAAWCA